MHYNLIAVLGPTAVGKTRLAALLAWKFDGEIISADSRQVYRGMDIGTGKDLDDYEVDGVKIPYHLVDVADPSEEFNLFLFNKLFHKAFDEIRSRSKIPFLAGGTGLFLHSVLKGYRLKEADFSKERFEELDRLDTGELAGILKNLNPELHNTTDLLFKERIIRAIMIAESGSEENDFERTLVNPLVLGVTLPRDEVKKRITNRLKFRLENGMIEETEKLVASGVSFEKLDFFGLEYRYTGLYLSGKINYNDMYQKLNSAIHRFAKRQMTWFRKMEKEGIVIHWIEGPDCAKAESVINKNYFGQAG